LNFELLAIVFVKKPSSAEGGLSFSLSSGKGKNNKGILNILLILSNKKRFNQGPYHQESTADLTPDLTFLPALYIKRSKVYIPEDMLFRTIIH